MAQTIVFVHGAWVNAACWTRYVEYFAEAGYRCIAPSWPGLDGDPRRLRADPPAALAQLGLLEIVDHYARIIEQLPRPPILIGHSFGGLVTQMLLARGVGRAGVAIHSAPPRGVLPSLTAVRASAGVLMQWAAWRRIVTMSPDTFGRDFANGLPEPERQAHYDQYVVPSSGRLFFQAALSLFRPALGLDYAAPRGPLLLVAGSADRTITADMNRRNHAKYARSAACTDYLEFAGRSHYTIAEPGWEDVAGEIVDWLGSSTVGLAEGVRRSA